MLFVVIRQIENLEEPSKLDHHIFILSDQARSYYRGAEYVCWNEPDDTPGGDPSIVTNCWLFAAETDDPIIAAQMAHSRRATLLAECFPPGS